jgi:hypothetical protein
VQDVAHRVGVSDLLRTMAPLDIQMLTPGAARIGQHQLTSNLLGATGQTYMAAHNPTAPAYALTDPLAEKVARFQTLPPQERMALLRDPRALEMLMKQRSIQIHNPQALAAG